jgi:hydrogenase maturation protease
VSASNPLITVIGIGNRYRGDDGAGPAVLAGLQDRFGADARVRLVELDGEPTRIIQAWEDCGVVWVVDAVRSTQPSGTIHRFVADDLGGVVATGVAFGGGHLLGLGEAIGLAGVLGRLPRALEVIGIEGADFGLGEELTECVAMACSRVVTELAGRLDELTERSTTSSPVSRSPRAGERSAVR